jgi:hypothetical protein
MFNAISVWINQNQTRFNTLLLLTEPLPPPPNAHTITLFPSFASYGVLAQAEINGTTDYPKDQNPKLELFWSIIAKYLASAININITPAFPATGPNALTPTNITSGIILTKWYWK